MVLMNVVYAAGRLSGRRPFRPGRPLTVLFVGLALLIAADLVLGLSSGLLGVLGGVVLWGLHMGFTQGLLSTLVADAAPPELRGTAFGMFNLLSGLALLAASVIAGGLWDVGGPEGDVSRRRRIHGAGVHRFAVGPRTPDGGAQTTGVAKPRDVNDFLGSRRRSGQGPHQP